MVPQPFPQKGTEYQTGGEGVCRRSQLDAAEDRAKTGPRTRGSSSQLPRWEALGGPLLMGLMPGRPGNVAFWLVTIPWVPASPLCKVQILLPAPLPQGSFPRGLGRPNCRSLGGCGPPLKQTRRRAASPPLLVASQCPLTRVRSFSLLCPFPLHASCPLLMPSPGH